MSHAIEKKIRELEAQASRHDDELRRLEGLVKELESKVDKIARSRGRSERPGGGFTW